MEANVGFRKAYKMTGNLEPAKAGSKSDLKELRGDGPVNKPTSVLGRVKVPGVNQDTRKTT